MILVFLGAIAILGSVGIRLDDVPADRHHLSSSLRICTAARLKATISDTVRQTCIFESKALKEGPLAR